MNEITIDDKIYISSKRAAEITGYAKDYVGQLCREGHIDAKMVGRGWYVYEPSIRAHRFGEVAPKEPETLEGSLDTVDDAVEVSREAKNELENTETEEEDTLGWNKPVYTAEVPQELPHIPAPEYAEPPIPAEQTLTDMQTAWREWFDRKQEVLATTEIESPEVIESRHEAENEIESDEEAVEKARQDEVIADTDQEEVEIPLNRFETEQDTLLEPGIRAPEGSVSVPIHTMPRYEEDEADTLRVQRSVGAYDVVPVITQTASLTGYRRQNAPQEARVLEERIIRRKGSVAPISRQTDRTKSVSQAPAIALLIGISLLSVAIAAIGSGKADRYFKTSLTENKAFYFLVGDREYIRQ